MWAWSGPLCDIVALAMKSIIASSVALLFASAVWAGVLLLMRRNGQFTHWIDVAVAGTVTVVWASTWAAVALHGWRLRPGRRPDIDMTVFD